jgi:uncharacterized repeat protein (TIGR01451 family)
MSRPAKNSIRIAILAALGLLLLAAAPASQAAIGPKWRLDSMSNTTAAPGGEARYTIQLTNVGDAKLNAATQAFSFTGTLPAGFSYSKVELVRGSVAKLSCVASVGASVSCTDVKDALTAPSESVPKNIAVFRIIATVNGGEVALGSRPAASFNIAGGNGVNSPSTVDPTLIAEAPEPFGLDAFDISAADEAGATSTEAAAHPDSFNTYIDFNTELSPVPLQGDLWPVQPTKDIVAELPPGFIGNPRTVETCTAALLANAPINAALPLCPPASQVGQVTLRSNGGGSLDSAYSNVPLFNMVTPPGSAARFGFTVNGSVITFDSVLRSGGDYGISVNSRSISEALALQGTTIEFWGVPASHSHDSERACPGEQAPQRGGHHCEAETAEKAFFRNPTSCTGPLTTTAHIDSWYDPGAWSGNYPDLSDPAWKTDSSVSHEGPGYPSAPEEWGAQVGMEGCGEVPFEPTFTATPTSHSADSPSGLDVSITVPQEALTEPVAIAQSDLKDARVLLPQGMSVNPSSAGGQGACTSAQIAINSPEPANCPDNAKIGEVEVQTPLLDHPVKGGVYLAAQGDNPFGSLLAMYLVIDDEASGVVLKLAGHVVANEMTGQLETAFTNQPQLPFEALHLDLFGGPRAALRTPAACGTYATTGTLTPWSGNAPVPVSSSFQIDQGCGGGFSPKLSAGTQNPLAGQTSPFTLRLTREDGTQELGGLSLTLPPGLSGFLKGIPYCPDSALAAVSGDLGTGVGQEGSPSCPAASQVGTVTVGAGAGTTPFFTSSGRAYLAGPYKGAPLSLAVVAPAVAGPFDLGSVVVRNALRVDPSTAQITAVSDPLPSILHGIPLDIRDVRVNLSRDHFTLNPTSCEPMAITSTITSTTGAAASPSQHFQVANCDQLGFKPKLALRLKGKTKRSGFPALSATLKMPEGGANIARAAVTLPPGLQIENAHIQEPCTRVQFNAEACPAKAILGRARAFSPLLDQPLEGPVYFRSNGGEHLLPDIVADLRGQIHVVLVGHIDSVENKHTGVVRIRNTFETVPDAPVSKFTLSLFGGKKGYLTNNRNLCNSANRALVKFDAQNGKFADSTPKVKTDCKKKAKSKHKR